MPPAYVKPYVKRQKNDMADAEAICEAVTRANMQRRTGGDVAYLVRPFETDKPYETTSNRGLNSRGAHPKSATAEDWSNTMS